MTSSFRTVLVAALALASILPGQRVRKLSLEDCFTLASQAMPPHDEPIAWLDADTYLVFEPTRTGSDGATSFVAVDAATGARRHFLEPGLAADLAALPGLRFDQVRDAMGVETNFAWSEDRSVCVLRLVDDLFVVRGPGAPRRLTTSPEVEEVVTVSPDGRLVAFVVDDGLRVVALDDGAELSRTEASDGEVLNGRLDWVYQEEVFGRGNWRGYWWSPDSTRIAFLGFDEDDVQQVTIPNEASGFGADTKLRYPTAGETNPRVRLGVLDVAGGGSMPIDLGLWRAIDPLVTRVQWTPDGSELFFQVQDRAQTRVVMMAASAGDGALREVFTEESPCWVEPGRDVVWLGGGESFLWPSERDGYEHLYRYTLGGELLGQVTRGEFEVDRVLDVDEAAGCAYVLSDRGSWREQHLFRVQLADGSMDRLTPDDGWHDVLLSPDRSRFVDAWSRAHRPTARSVRSIDGGLVRALAEPRLDVLELSQVRPPRFVQIPTRDGFPMEAMLFEPPGFEPGQPVPVLQHVYGGPHAPRVLDRWRGRDSLWHQRIAQRGYLVAVVDNRSASGKGRVSACAAYRRLGQTELADLEDAADWLAREGYALEGRIGLWGWSYGGYQTLFNLTHSARWAAGVAVNPVTDWRFYDSIYTERYMGLPQDNAAGYDAASPLVAAARLAAPLLLVHATMDDNVHFRNSMRLAHTLQQAQRSFRFLPYPGVAHGIEDGMQQRHLFHEIEVFLAETIGRAQ
ncbi:MAG: DPP IV N-terminal domain-containing protein [Planctomycetota bacterium]|nr:DPP IV N-terminal domain-containing protein [Planctomycetota bacterium]